MKTMTKAGLLLTSLLFLTTAFSLTAAEAAKPTAPADELFDQPKVWPIKIEIPQASLDALKKEPKQYVKANVREGDKTYAEVGLRIKGNDSFQSIEKRPSLTIKFNEFASEQMFHGHTRIALENAADDPTYLCAAIGGEVFRAAGVPALKVTFARVEINGQDLGLYVLEQVFNRDFLSEHFKRSKGTLYEGSDADVNEKLERDGGDKSKEPTDLRALTSAAQEGDHGQRLRKLGTVMDLDRFIAFVATEVFAGRAKGYTMGRNNYRIYHDPGSDKLVFMPESLDKLCEKPNAPLLPACKGLVAKAVLDTAEGQKRYREQMAKLLTTAFKVETLHARINELAGRVRPAAARDANATKAFDSGVAQLRERLSERARFLDQQLKQPAPGK